MRKNIIPFCVTTEFIRSVILVFLRDIYNDYWEKYKMNVILIKRGPRFGLNISTPWLNFPPSLNFPSVLPQIPSYSLRSSSIPSNPLLLSTTPPLTLNDSPSSQISQLPQNFKTMSHIFPF